MKVKIGNKIYDAENEPIMVILNENDKKNIARIPPDGTAYCSYPNTKEWIENEGKKLKAWMQEDTP